MVKKSLLWVYRATLWLIGGVLIVLALAALGVHFLLLPNINHYKDRIAAYASQSTQQKIVIGHINADWQGLNPHFSISNIDLFDAQNRPALQLSNTEVTLSWLSIPKLEPHLDALVIRNPELTIRRTPNGEIFIAGISTRGESKPEAMNWLLRQTQLSVVNAKVVWLDELRQAPALSLNQLNLDIVSPPWKRLIKNHEIKFSAIPSTGTLNPIVVTGNVYGNDVSTIEQWRGNLDVVLINANIAAFTPWVDYPIEVQQGVVSTKSNIKFANSRLQSSINDIKVAHLAFKAKGNHELQHIKALSGTLAWQNLAVGKTPSPAYHFDVRNVQISTNQGLNLQAVNARYSKTVDARTLFQLKLTEFNLQALMPYILQIELPTDIQSALIGMAPKGVLSNLALQWQGRQQETLSYLIDTRFKGLSVLAYDKLPGFSNLTGSIKADHRAGLLTLDTKNAQLDLKGILRWPVPVNQLRGEILWDIDGDETDVKTNQLAISNAHLAGVVNALYKHDQKGGYLDLKGKFGQANVKFASFYYPLTLGEQTLKWLDTSIKEGRAEDINLIVKGRLADFPFVNQQHRPDSKLGQFKVTAKVSDALLEYGTGWPPIAGLGLDLLFEGKRMELNAFTGHVLGNQIVRSKATIEQLDAKEPILNVVSEVKGPVPEAIRFVNNSPVLEVAQGFTTDLKTGGTGVLNLSLKIPMDNVDASQYKGAYAISNGSLESGTTPTLNSISGVLEFTENNLFAKNIRASAFNAPLVFNLQSGKDKAIRITARGRVNDEAIKQTLGNAARYLSGTADWAADIVVQKPKISVGMRSDLFGLTSTLPAPFNKVANERIGLRIDKKQDGNVDVTTIVLGSRLGARVISALESNQLVMNRAVVNLNDRGPNSGFDPFNQFNSLTNAPKGLQVYGTLNYLNVDTWRSINADLKADQTAATTKPSSSPAFVLGKSDVKINTLDIFDRRINQLHFQNKTARDDLQFNIQSREISGDIQWASQNNGRLIARLSKLTIPEAIPRLKATPPVIKEPVKSYQKLEQDYPALDITAASFEIDKKQLGGLELVAYPQQEDWIIKKLKLTNPDNTLNAEGEWNNWTRNPNTRLNVDWDIQDLGNTLNRLGYPDVIKGGKGDLKGQLNWAGSPHEFDTLSLNGNLQFEMRQGQVLQVKPGVGRLFGLLSLQSLPRRLSLDFKDLFNSGFAFDKINATVLIDRGILRSDNFMMAGPAADVTIKGETNLRTETQHLYVRVVPNISDSISLAALAGGPLAGAVAFLAQKILKDPLNKIASTEYEIVGTWDEPRETKTTEPAINNNDSPLN